MIQKLRIHAYEHEYILSFEYSQKLQHLVHMRFTKTFRRNEE